MFSRQPLQSSRSALTQYGQRLLIGVLLALHVGLLSHTIATYSPTVDEVSHLSAGLSHWRFGRFDLYRVNPPLVQGVAAIPLLFCDHKEDWSQYSTSKTTRREFAVGRKFVGLNGSDSIRLYRYGRLACIPFSLIGAISVYWFARELFGCSAGIVAMSLWCFSPNVLGNAAIVTPDVAGGAMAILAAFAFWRWLSCPRLNRSLIAGLTLGLAQLAKTTCVIFYVLWPVLWLIWLWRYRLAADRRPRREAGQLLIVVLLAIYLTNLGYLFDGSFSPLKDYSFVSLTLGGPKATLYAPHNRFQGTILGEIPVPFPIDYVQGIDLQKLDFEGERWSYAGGVHKPRGWWWWYLYALAVKVPHGTMLLGLMASMTTWIAPEKQRSSLARGNWLLLVPAICVLVLVSSQTGFSRYLRYLLPAFPFVYVWLSRVAESQFLKYRCWSLIVGAAVLWNVWSCARCHPHHLAYFNEASGGADHGHWHLLDANVDWGQASLALREWLAMQEQRQPVYLSLFGEGYCMKPVDLGLVGGPIPLAFDRTTNLNRSLPLGNLPPGLYAISVNHLHAYRHHHLGEPDCSEFLKLRPIATIGYAIQIFQLPPATPTP